MPTSKKQSNKPDQTSTQPSINIAHLGRKYYDVLDVYSNKLISKIVENSSDLNIDKEVIIKINKIIFEETANAKNWGIDQLISVTKSK